MKNQNKLKFTISLLIVICALNSNFAYSSSKQKPPTAVEAVSLSWYQPILDFFNF